MYKKAFFVLSSLLFSIAAYTNDHSIDNFSEPTVPWTEEMDLFCTTYYFGNTGDKRVIAQAHWSPHEKEDGSLSNFGGFIKSSSSSNPERVSNAIRLVKKDNVLYWKVSRKIHDQNPEKDKEEAVEALLVPYIKGKPVAFSFNAYAPLTDEHYKAYLVCGEGNAIPKGLELSFIELKDPKQKTRNLSSEASETTQNSAQKAASQWTSSYTRTNPIAAFNTSMPIPLNPSFYQKSRSGLTVNLGAQHRIDKEPVKSFQPLDLDIDKIKAASSQELRELSPEEKASLLFLKRINSDDRDKAIAQNMSEFLETTEPKEMKIAFVGSFHAMDFWMLDPNRQDTLFAMIPYNESTQFYTPETLQFNKVLDRTASLILGTPQENMLKLSKTDESDRVTDFSANLPIYIYARLASETPFNEELYQKAYKGGAIQEPLSRLVIGDTHNIDSTKIFTDLPSGKQLRALGFDKVSIGMEGFPMGKEVSLSELEQTLSFRIQSTINELSPELLEHLKRQHPDEYRFLQEGKVTKTPTASAFANKLIEWGKEIPVSIIGIDSKSF